MFRLVEAASGTIMIDNVNIRDVPLQVLRTRVSILVQDPVLFTGTVRYAILIHRKCDLNQTSNPRDNCGQPKEQFQLTVEFLKFCWLKISLSFFFFFFSEYNSF